MATIEMEVSQFQVDETDFCDSVLSRFSNSIQEEHQHLCTVLGAMSQELKEQNLPTTPVTYFCTTCSSIDRLSSDPDSPSHIIDSLLTILSMVLPRISPVILKKKREYLSELVVRVFRSKSPPAASGLKCISHLLMIRESDNWSDVSQLYGLLLSFITDPHSKVRRQSHVCIHDTLQNFQGSSALAPASEGIINTFERYLLLAGGSNAAASESPKGAQEVLYILDALKECLPLMSMKSTTTVLKYLKTLLELHQPLVSRRIMDSLNVLCLDPTSEVSPEVLLELLCSLALSVSGNERIVDDITFTTRLLDVGMRKVHSLDRKICIVKLPAIFNALGDVLACEHEEALHAATEALKSLIHACIDLNLIKQGVNQIMTNADMETRRSRPTIIEKLCATIESLLDYRFSTVWDMSFQVISTMFNKLGENSSYLLMGTLKGLADLQKLPDEDLIYRKQLHECIGSALVAMGPEIFLSIVPLKLEVEDLSEANVWILPILKQYTIGAHLSFFRESILNMVQLMKQKSRMLHLEGRIVSSRSYDALVYSLWSLLPSFCNYPLDTAESFKDIEKALCTALREEANLCGIICSSLQILIQQNKGILERKIDLNGSDNSISRQRAMARYTPQVAGDNLTVLKSSAREFLSVLSGKFLKSAQDGGCLQSTIHELASVADKEIVTRFFRNTMQKLLKVTQEAGNAQTSRNSNTMELDNSSNGSLAVVRSQLFDLAVSLLPGLDAKEIDLLFVAIKPALRDDEGLIQKKAYKVLSIILRNCDTFLSARFEELLKLMIEVLPSCHFSAKHHRLECLYSLIVHASKCESEKRCDIISSFLTEIILALKEANKKTRNRAYDMLVQIGHACGDEEKGGKKENLHQFFNMVAAGLAGETPHMISAAVKGLARLAYEFSDLVSTTYNLLPSTFLLLKRKNREIAKANLGLLKVLVAKSQTEGLQMHLRSMVEGLLNWQDSTKNQFKAKVKLLLEMLVKKCGMDAVKAVMPEEHMKLLTNIRKIKERKERNLAANSEETRSQQSKATTSRLSRWNHTKIFSSFGAEDSEDSDAEYTDGKTLSGQQSKATLHFNSKASSSRMHKAAKSLPEDLFDQLEDEPLDLLDRHKTRSALRSTGGGHHLKRKHGLEDEPEIDSEGRLIIREGGGGGGGKPRREVSSSNPESEDVRSQAGSSHKSINSSIEKNGKRRKTSDSGWAYTGGEYASKKAAGDVKRKDKLEPYAYWPLDRKMMSRRPEHRAAARKGMASVVRLAKKLEGKSVSSALSSKALRFKRVQKKSSKKKSK